MAGALERRMDLARSALQARAGETSRQQQEAMQRKFASTGGLQSGAAIKGSQAAERALSRQELAAESDIARSEAQTMAEQERAAMQRRFAQEEAARSREFAVGEAKEGRAFATAQSALDRKLGQQQIDIAKKELDLNEQISLDNLARFQAELAKDDRTTAEKLGKIFSKGEWERQAKEFKKPGAKRAGDPLPGVGRSDTGKRKKTPQQQAFETVKGWFGG